MTKDTISVNTLMNLYSNSLTSTLDAKLVVVEGFYQDNSGKLYGKVYYDHLLDKDKESKITIQLTESLKSKLTSGRYFHLEGYINKAQTLTNDSRLKVFFRATKVLKHEEDVQLISKVEYDIVRERYNREFPIVRDILLKLIERDTVPSIGLITGIDSTAIADYQSQLYDDEFYNIDIHKCNLSSKTEIVNLIESKKLSNYDLIIVVRGGGQGLEVFNDIELSRKLIEQPIPFITGIGHKDDVTLLQRVADKALATPTAVGIFLQKAVDSYKENQRLLNQKDFEMQKYQEQTNLEIENINERFIQEKKNSKKLVFILGLVIVVLLIIISVK